MSVRQLFNLAGKTALITGGSRGLGLQMAEALGEMGARLAITARKADELAAAKAHLEGLGIEVATFTNDLQQFDAIPALVDAVLAELGTIDILVNNAGATWGAPAEDHPLAAWDKVTAKKAAENPMFKKVLESMRAFAQRSGRWQNDTTIDYRMAWNHYFAPKKKG